MQQCFKDPDCSDLCPNLALKEDERGKISQSRGRKRQKISEILNFFARIEFEQRILSLRCNNVAREAFGCRLVPLGRPLARY
jgi:hypothetical protein